MSAAARSNQKHREPAEPPSNDRTRRPPKHVTPEAPADHPPEAAPPPPPSSLVPVLETPAAPGPRTDHPAFTAPVRYQSMPRPDDDEAATRDTISLMARLIREDAGSAPVRAAAADAASGIPRDQVQKLVAAVFWWIKRHVRLTPDAELARGIAGLASLPEETEVLIRPADILTSMRQAQGDCDDFSMLAAAMLRALGIPAYLVTIAADPAAPGQYSHVYVVARTPQGEIALDTSHGPRPAWSARAAGKSRKWEIDNVQRPLGEVAPWYIDLLKIGAQTGADIAKLRATPAGYYQQAGPQGTTVFRQQPGGGVFEFPSAQVGNATPMLLLFGLVGVGLILALRRN